MAVADDAWEASIRVALTEAVKAAYLNADVRSDPLKVISDSLLKQRQAAQDGAAAASSAEESKGLMQMITQASDTADERAEWLAKVQQDWRDLRGAPLRPAPLRVRRCLLSVMRADACRQRERGKGIRQEQQR